VSKERARRRTEREAARAAAEAKRLRIEARRSTRRALVRSLRPKIGRRGRLTGRRSPAQRTVLVVVALGLGWVVWYLVDGWPVRIAFWLLLLLLLPVFAVVSFDRKGMKL
jgi:Flp pilus assembly protein TadB